MSLEFYEGGAGGPRNEPGLAITREGSIYLNAGLMRQIRPAISYCRIGYDFSLRLLVLIPSE